MAYIEQSISKEEQLITFFEFHWTVWIPTAIAIIIGTVFLFVGLIGSISSNASGVILILVVGVVIYLPAVYSYLDVKTSERALTSKRVITKSGIIGMHTEEARLTQIESIEVRQGVIDRIFGSGTLKITGTGMSIMLVTNLEDPLSVKRIIESKLD
jgi:uncharacterized membrane protein YdbT with pleckstrin-like domain